MPSPALASLDRDREPVGLRVLEAFPPASGQAPASRTSTCFHVHVKLQSLRRFPAAVRVFVRVHVVGSWGRCWSTNWLQTGLPSGGTSPLPIKRV